MPSIRSSGSIRILTLATSALRNTFPTTSSGVVWRKSRDMIGLLIEKVFVGANSVVNVPSSNSEREQSGGR